MSSHSCKTVHLHQLTSSLVCKNTQHVKINIIALELEKDTKTKILIFT